jgi:hypothetical protein
MVQRDDVLERDPAEIAHHAEGIGEAVVGRATCLAAWGLVTLFRLAHVQQQS